MPGRRTLPLTSTTIRPPGPPAGGGPGDGSGVRARSTPRSMRGSDAGACAPSVTGSGARTDCGRADQKWMAAKTAAATRTTASAARVLGSRPHLSCNHIGSRSRTAGTSRSHRPGVIGAVGTARAFSSAGVRCGTGGGPRPTTGRATRPPYAPAMSASARCREAAATPAARPRANRRRPGAGPGPEPDPGPCPGPTSWPTPDPRRARTSDAAARPGPLPLVARCARCARSDRGAMPHDARHIRPNPLRRPNSGGKPTGCG